MRVSMIGTRGVPATYGGFETAVEEIGTRLAARGHDVTVYSRPLPEHAHLRAYRGMTTVPLPAMRRKSLETLSHTGVSIAHCLVKARPDVALVFNAANAVYLPLLRTARVPVATHVDGLEWRRAKWSGTGQRYYRNAEEWAVRGSDALIADARGIADYYTDEFGVATELIAYGAPILEAVGSAHLPEGVTAGRYHLVVARFEPENHVREIVAGYHASTATDPLIVVGGAPFAEQYTRDVHAAAGDDPRIRFLGPVYDQQCLDELYANARSYLHGHSVGGTNPSLLRAMGAAATVIAYDVPFNREVLAGGGWYFADPAGVARALAVVEADPDAARAAGTAARDHAARTYTWDDVADRYEDLCRRLCEGYTIHGTVSGRRNPDSPWSRPTGVSRPSDTGGARPSDTDGTRPSGTAPGTGS